MEVFPCCGPIAQWIEHPPSKRMVAGSNPARSGQMLLSFQILSPFSREKYF